MASIKISNLNFSYPNATLRSLSEINLDLVAGKITGILGPNGAGKTTLASVVCGIFEPENGTINFLDKGGSSKSRSDLKIGLIPQDFAFYEELSALNNLKYFGALYNIEKSLLDKKCEELLKVVGLTEVQNKKVSSYSGGMKRRLNLILGIIHDPEIIILDEPTTGVDIQSRRAISDCLTELRSENRTIIYSSHHLREAQDICDDIALLDNGKLIAKGSMQDLLKENEVDGLEALYLKYTGEEMRDFYV